MFFRLLLLFILIPIIELALLLKLADAISWQWTLMIVIVTGVVGSWLARSQGLQAYRRIQQSLARGEAPADAVVDALLILVAGGMLLTPGILTDLVGLAFLFPPTRQLFKQGVTRWLRAHVKVTTHFNMAEGDPRPPSARHGAPPGAVIDSYVVGSDDTDE